MNCDRIAPWYRWMEYASFAGALHRRRCAFLPDLRDARKALVLGDGDGRFLTALAQRYPELEIDAIDSSREMLRLAARRTPPSDRVRFHLLDALRDPLPGRGYDLVVTHFFLDCFTTAETEQLIAKISDATSPHALWVLSEFHEPSSGWRRLRARLWVAFLYFAFRLTTGLRTRHLPEFRLALQAHGFHVLQQRFASHQLLVSELWHRPA